MMARPNKLKKRELKQLPFWARKNPLFKRYCQDCGEKLDVIAAWEIYQYPRHTKNRPGQTGVQVVAYTIKGYCYRCQRVALYKVLRENK
jgi:hypothetical protein